MSRKNNFFIYLFILLFFPVKIIFAQVNDAGMWVSFNAEKKITPVLSVNLSQEFRINENISEFGTFFTDAGINYKISKVFRVSANYRFVNKRRLNDSYSVRHRFYFDFTVRKKFKPLILQFRTRFQNQYTDMYSSSEGLIPDIYSRNKLTLKIDIDKKYVPYLYTELFTPLKNIDLAYINNARFCAGFEYNFNRMHSLDFFYLLQKEMNVTNPETDYIIGVGYYFTF